MSIALVVLAFLSGVCIDVGREQRVATVAFVIIAVVAIAGAVVLEVA